MNDANKKNSVFILNNRSILYINGLDAKDFLQNLISNDINKVTDNSSCFASLLTPQGKFLYEFIVIRNYADKFLPPTILSLFSNGNPRNLNKKNEKDKTS